ncbi:MAG: hypothetical protein JWQ55_1770 [Rhodopila sp.]|jgi:hypothetical protein|nr:hypothetical protein [Rhodopila sp.]
MIKIATASALFFASSIGAIAAPFCLVIPNGTPQCIYVDGASCAADASRQNGSCQVNPAEVRLPASRVGEYCLIMPGGSSICGYSDGNVCSRDALRQKGACSLSAGATTVRIPDAYAPNAGR